MPRNYVGAASRARQDKIEELKEEISYLKEELAEASGIDPKATEIIEAARDYVRDLDIDGHANDGRLRLALRAADYPVNL